MRELITFLLCLFWIATAEGQARVVVLDPTLPKEWVNSLVWEAQALHGIQFLPTRYRRDPLGGQCLEWSSKVCRISRLKNSKLHRQMLRRAKVVHYLHGKTAEGYLGGLAYQSGLISIGYAAPVLASGADASDKAVTIITHEVGHTRCATHVESATIMNTLALASPIQPRIWDAVSVYQISRCGR